MEGDSICESGTSHTGPTNKKRKTTNIGVSLPENANTADSHPVKDSSPFRFTWRIDKFSQMNTINLYSDVFEVGGYKWRVLVVPKGCTEDYLSVFLDVADSENLPIGWSCYAQFSLTVVNQINNKDSDLRPIPLLLKKRWGDILLFFKLYKPEKEELSYVGRLKVNWNDMPLEILTKLNKLAGYVLDEEIELYKEITFEPKVMCEPVDKKLTFRDNQLDNGDIICFQKAFVVDNVKHIRHPDVPSFLEYVHNHGVPLSPSVKDSQDEKLLEEQNENIIAEEMKVDKNTEAQQSNVDIETTHDHCTSKANTSKFVNKNLEEIDAMMDDDDVIAAIDRVLSEGITLSIQSHQSVQRQEFSTLDPNLGEQLLQELRDIVFKEDLVEKIKQCHALNVSFNAVKEKIDANANLFSSYQLEQVNTIVNLVNNIVRMFEELENLKKEKDSAKKITDQDNEALKETRQKILTSKTSLTNHQTQLNSLDVEIADFKAKLEKLECNRDKIVEIQNQEKDKITLLNKEVKSIFYRLVDDKIKLKIVEDKIPERQTELESHEKLYQIFKASPPF